MLTVPDIVLDGRRLEIVTHESGNQSVLSRAGTPPAPRERQGTIAWYVPYSRVHEETVAGAPADAVWVDVSSCDVAYYAALHRIWELGETFALLEHDVVARPDVIEAFEECPEPWCAFGYSDICHRDCMEAWRNTLGCTRFRSELIDAVPDAVSGMPAEMRDWHVTCDGLGNALRAAGYSQHWHFPWVEHHHFHRHDRP